jgi:hypothetical protein
MACRYSSAKSDIVVPAKYTEQITTAEENGSGTMVPHQHSLFAKMRSIARNLCIGSGAAQADLSRQTIDIAPPRAQRAFCKQPPALVNPPIQQT